MSRHIIPDGCMGHEEIARVLGVSRSLVQLIEAEGLRKMRRAFGSSATGPASAYLAAEFEGVPEPGENENADKRRRYRRTVGGGRRG